MLFLLSIFLPKKSKRQVEFKTQNGSTASYILTQISVPGRQQLLLKGWPLAASACKFENNLAETNQRSRTKLNYFLGTAKFRKERNDKHHRPDQTRPVNEGGIISPKYKLYITRSLWPGAAQVFGCPGQDTVSGRGLGHRCIGVWSTCWEGARKKMLNIFEIY